MPDLCASGRAGFGAVGNLRREDEVSQAALAVLIDSPHCNTTNNGGGGGFVLACEDFERMLGHSPPVLFFFSFFFLLLFCFVFEVNISSGTQIPLF